MNRSITDISKLIHACDAGDVAARRQFQDEYGEDIYYFPVKLHGLPPEKAGDFYVYAFDNDRIFTRLRTFAGRKDIQFRTFLSFFVLKSLFLDWLRTVKEPDTIPLDDETAHSTAPEEHLTPDLWIHLSPEEQLDLKLLCLIECDLNREETRLLAARSGRSLRDTLLLLEEIQQKLRRKDEKLTTLQDALDSVWGWILLRQRDLQEIDEKIRLSMASQKSVDALIAQRKTVEEALEKRYRQREKLLEELRTYKLTTPYSDLARLLNTTVGTVCSRLFRLRKRLGEGMGAKRTPEEDTP